jgi:hypothetical protein
MPQASDAPGLRRMKRHNGREDCYWIPNRAAQKAGYTPKVVRLTGDADRVAHQCRILQAEMLEWLGGKSSPANMHEIGTVAWLVNELLTDAESPIRDRRADTQKFYDRYGAKVIETVGKRKLAQITGKDVRRWHKDWCEMFGDRGGYACIQTLRRAIGNGCEMRDQASFTLSQVMQSMEFSQPKRRSAKPTHEMIAALLPVAAASKHGAVGLATLLQFELGLRQRDVIGEWVRAGDGGRNGIMDGQWRWQWGLTWDQIDSNWILAKPTSKSNGRETSEHDLKRYPALLAILQSVPKERRIGPVILDPASGKPYRASHFSHTFRKLATQAGWPADVRNMDSRAGMVSEAFEAGATEGDVMAAATHRELKTTLGYRRGTIDQTSRVADLRAERRKRQNGT